MKENENKIEKVEILAPENLKNNEIFIEDYGVVKIRPTKLKYFWSEDKKQPTMYSSVKLIQQMGYNNILPCADGREVLTNALTAIFDTDKIDFIDYLTTKNLIDICDKADEINEVKENDFLLEANAIMEKGEEEENLKSNKKKIKKA